VLADSQVPVLRTTGGPKHCTIRAGKQGGRREVGAHCRRSSRFRRRSNEDADKEDERYERLEVHQGGNKSAEDSFRPSFSSKAQFNRCTGKVYVTFMVVPSTYLSSRNPTIHANGAERRPVVRPPGVCITSMRIYCARAGVRLIFPVGGRAVPLRVRSSLSDARSSQICACESSTRVERQRAGQQLAESGATAPLMG
jgi:hypothetical protein